MAWIRMCGGGDTTPKPIVDALSATSTSRSNPTGWIYNRYEKPVNLTKVKSVTIEYTVSASFYVDPDGNSYYDTVQAQVGVSVGNSGAFTKYAQQGGLFTGNKSTSTYTRSFTSTIDVSELSGLHYIGCGVYESSYPSYPTNYQDWSQTKITSVSFQ